MKRTRTHTAAPDAVSTTDTTNSTSAVETNAKSDKRRGTVKPTLLVTKKHGAPKLAGQIKPEASYGSDGSPQVLNETVDPIIREHGPLVDLSDERPKLNTPAIAAKFLDEDGIVFDETINGVRRYDESTGIWARLSGAQTKKLLAAFLKRLADKLECPAILPMRTDGWLNSVINFSKGVALIGTPEPGEDLIHVKNGVVEFIDGEPKLRVRRREDRATKCCAHDYDGNAKCPTFLDNLLKPALPDPADVDLLQRWFGAVLLGRNDAQRFLQLHGVGETGKSTFITIIESILGHHSVAHLRTGYLSGRFETHFFQGKTLLAGKDVPPDALLNKGANAIKYLTGADRTESEKKFGEKFSMEGIFNLVLTSNRRLLIKLEDDASAWLRRLIVIEFTLAPRAAKIVKFAETLVRTEGDGILAWGIRGAAKLLTELKDKGDFVLTPAQQDRVKDLVLESNSIEEFVASDVVKSAKSDVTGVELHEGYLAFCRTRKWLPVVTKKFQTALADLMTAQHGVHKRNDIRRGVQFVRGFKGVALRMT